MTTQPRHTRRPRDVVIEVNEPFFESLSPEQAESYVQVIVDAHALAETMDQETLKEYLADGFAARGVPIDPSRPGRIAEQMLLDLGHGLTIITDGGRLLYGNPIEDQAHHIPGVVGTEDPMDKHRPFWS